MQPRAYPKNPKFKIQNNTFARSRVIHKPVSWVTATGESDDVILTFVLTRMRAIAFVDVAFVLIGEVRTIVDSVAKEVTWDAKVVGFTFEVVRTRASARVGLE